MPGEAQLRRMVSAGECWGDDNRPHPYPTPVWVAVPYGGAGDVQYVLRGSRGVDRALEQLQVADGGSGAGLVAAAGGAYWFVRARQTRSSNE